MSLPGSPWARRLAAVVTLAATFVLGLLSVHLTPPHAEVAGWWPAAGVSVGLLAVAPRRSWPLLVVGLVVFTGAANLVGGRGLDLSTGANSLRRHGTTVAACDEGQVRPVIAERGAEHGCGLGIFR